MTGPTVDKLACADQEFLSGVAQVHLTLKRSDNVFVCLFFAYFVVLNLFYRGDPMVICKEKIIFKFPEGA